MDKAALRQKHLDRRQQTDPVLIEAASFVIQEKLWSKVKDAASIGIYISMDHEVQTIGIIQKALAVGKIVVVPKIVDRKMIFVRLKDLNLCVKSRYGILEPISVHPYEGPINVQVIPMLAYNDRLFRLGYGKGYYDAYLKDYPGLKLGICFSQDHEPELIETQNDVACDEILTET